VAILSNRIKNNFHLLDELRLSLEYDITENKGTRCWCL
jgi:hypothetical protein